METRWGDMLGELIPDILSRLPVKSLLRFRCVSKSWYTLISDPYFIDKHLKFNQNSANESGYILIQHGYSNSHTFSVYCDETLVERTRFELPFNRSRFESVRVNGYCNGLLCISCLGGLTSRYKSLIWLWNPSIQKFKALPDSLSSSLDIFLTFMFVPRINDYKVLKLFYRGFLEKNPSKVEIYSLRLNSWKEIQSVVPCQIFRNCVHPIVNGIVHWAGNLKETEREDDSCRFILTFDMVNEVFGKMNVPEFCRGDDPPATVTVLNNSLSLFVYSGEGENHDLDVWVMKEYGVVESWTKLFTIDLWVDEILGFMKNGEIVIMDMNHEIFLYNTSIKQVNNLRIDGVLKRFGSFTCCTESLVLLNEGN